MYQCSDLAVSTDYFTRDTTPCMILQLPFLAKCYNTAPHATAGLIECGRHQSCGPERTFRELCAKRDKFCRSVHCRMLTKVECCPWYSQIEV